MAGRFVTVVAGVILLVANHRGGEGTFLGFYSLASVEMMGYNVVTLVVSGLAIWMVYRGLRGRSA